MNVTTTNPAQWKYISEGGATIVFSYVGPHDPDFSGMVLRLRKAKHGSEHRETNADEPDDPSIAFQHRCMERLIPPVHLPALKPVFLSQPWLVALSALHAHERPQSRRDNDGIDLARQKGVLGTDVVGSKPIAVEIKPKWSFLPNTVFLSQETHPVKSRTCRFCMHSSLKASQGEEVAIGYCPLDLFSSDSARVRSAVCSLYDAWFSTEGKVNNLKIFVHGRKIAVEQRHTILVSGELPDEDLRDAFADALLPFLVQTPVLQILNKLQRTLDILDVEGLSILWSQAHSDPVGVGAEDPTLEEWSAFIDTYLSGQTFSWDQPRAEDLRHYMLAYLLSATFKDCSIIIRTDLVTPSSPNDVDPSMVTVIDLDPKGLNRLHKWKGLDEDIVTAYASINVDERKTCVDDWV